MTHAVTPSSDVQARAARASGRDWLTGPQALALWHAGWAVASALIGLLGGAIGALYPAVRAANLDAVSALSYE